MRLHFTVSIYEVNLLRLLVIEFASCTRACPQVTHSSGLKMNFKENKTAKSYFSCSLSSFLGFWVVWSRSESFLDHSPLPLIPEKRRVIQKNSQNSSKTTQKPRKDDNDQLMYDLAVLFSLKFIFNPEECVTCGLSTNIIRETPRFRWLSPDQGKRSQI